MMQPRVVLFDIDGTLLVSGGAGRRSMTQAFADERLPAEAGAFDFGGMTDRAIVRRALLGGNNADAPTEADIDRCLERYLAYLSVEVPRSEGYRLLPGAIELANRLRAQASVAVGLGTGNVVRGARIKLGRAGVFESFGFGGFGCDHEERHLLIKKGAERGAERLGVTFADCDVVIIGDTPKDVAAAQAIGARCLAVATGRNTEKELADSGAHLTVADLTDSRVESFVFGS